MEKKTIQQPYDLFFFFSWPDDVKNNKEQASHQNICYFTMTIVTTVVVKYSVTAVLVKYSVFTVDIDVMDSPPVSQSEVTSSSGTVPQEYTVSRWCLCLLLSILVAYLVGWF